MRSWRNEQSLQITKCSHVEIKVTGYCGDMAVRGKKQELYNLYLSLIKMITSRRMIGVAHSTHGRRLQLENMKERDNFEDLYIETG
jgi:hypothetical protein